MSTHAGRPDDGARFDDRAQPTAFDTDKRELAVRLDDEKAVQAAKIRTMLGISKPALYACVRSAKTVVADIVDRIEYMKVLAAGNLVMNEVEASALVRQGNLGQRRRGAHGVT